MISCITGKPGAGKSYVATQLAWEAACRGRSVCTNLPLRGEWPVQVRRLEVEDLRDFWLWRFRDGVWVKHRDLGECGGAPCLYVLDEAHLVWGSREWREVGREVLSYWSQHRKLGDDVVLVTQAAGALDKAIRRLVSEWVVVRNLEREPLGGFRVARVRVVWSLVEPERQDWSRWIYRTEWIRLSREVFDRYNSFAGLGIAEGTLGGDNMTAARGRHWLWGVGYVVGVVLLLVGGALVVSRAGAWYASRLADGSRVVVGTNSPGVSVGVADGAGTSAVGAVRGEWRRVRVLVVEDVPWAGLVCWRVAAGRKMSDEIEDVGVRVGERLIGLRSVVDVEGHKFFLTSGAGGGEMGAEAAGGTGSGGSAGGGNGK